MICAGCGANVPDGSKFCNKCGGAFPQVTYTQNQGVQIQYAQNEYGQMVNNAINQQAQYNQQYQQMQYYQPVVEKQYTSNKKKTTLSVVADVLVFVGAFLPVPVVNILLLVAALICACVDIGITDHRPSKSNDVAVIIVSLVLILAVVSFGGVFIVI